MAEGVWVRTFILHIGSIGGGPPWPMAPWPISVWCMCESITNGGVCPRLWFAGLLLVFQAWLMDNQALKVSWKWSLIVERLQALVWITYETEEVFEGRCSTAARDTQVSSPLLISGAKVYIQADSFFFSKNKLLYTIWILTQNGSKFLSNQEYYF